MKKWAVLFGILAIVGWLIPDAAYADIRDFTGRWVNTNANSRNVERLNIQVRGDEVFVRAWTDCPRRERCNLGRVKAEAYGPNPGADEIRNARVITAEFRPGVGRRLLTIRRARNNNLRVTVYWRFGDQRRRNSYVSTHTFRRAGRADDRDRVQVREDCVGFNPGNIQIQLINGNWTLVDGRHRIKSFGPLQFEGFRVREVIQRYNLNQICFVGRPNPSLEYWKAGGRIPQGGLGREDCVAMNPDNARLQRLGGSWTIVEAGHRIKAFPNENEARVALAIMRRSNARFMCYVGRPNPIMTYLRR